MKARGKREARRPWFDAVRALGLKGRNILRPVRAGCVRFAIPGATRFALAPGFHIPRLWRCKKIWRATDNDGRSPTFYEGISEACGGFRENASIAVTLGSETFHENFLRLAFASHVRDVNRKGRSINVLPSSSRGFRTSRSCVARSLCPGLQA
jgi:hypothetical protein